MRVHAVLVHREQNCGGTDAPPEPAGHRSNMGAQRDPPRLRHRHVEHERHGDAATGLDLDGHRRFDLERHRLGRTGHTQRRGTRTRTRARLARRSTSPPGPAARRRLRAFNAPAQGDRDCADADGFSTGFSPEAECTLVNQHNSIRILCSACLFMNDQYTSVPMTSLNLALTCHVPLMYGHVCYVWLDM